MSFNRAIVAGALFAALAPFAPPASAQSTLVDGTVVVVTGDGLYMVTNQVTTKVFGRLSFGGSMLAPSVSWIDGTNDFIVTTREDLSGNPGGVWRVTLAPDATGTKVDLTPTMPAWIEPRFIDADYSPGLDTLFLLQAQTGQIVSWAQPAQASLATLTLWGTVPPDDARSIAVRGAKQPFSVVCALGSGPVLRVDALGTTTLYQTGSWDDIATNPVGGELIVAKQAGDVIGQVASASLLFDFNVSGLCGPLVPQPSDVEWDPIAGRAVGIASDPMPGCALGFGAVGENHIVRLPLTAGGGPSSNQPVLLTPVGVSGITGQRADMALVRLGASEVTYSGYPGPGDGTSEPLFTHQGPMALGKTPQLKLTQAPPSAVAYLVLGLSSQPAVFKGHPILPAPQALWPALTSATGAAQFAPKMPANGAVLVGLEVFMQWIVDDTTTPAADDIAASQAAVFTIGVK